MRQRVLYFLLSLVEIALYAFHSFAENLLNRHLAVVQMEIKTGFWYEYAMETVHFVYAVCALSILAIAFIFYFINKKENEKND